MIIKITMTEFELKQLILEHFATKLSELNFKADDIKIEVKSKANYKAEWEVAEFRATYEGFGL